MKMDLYMQQRSEIKKIWVFILNKVYLPYAPSEKETVNTKWLSEDD